MHTLREVPAKPKTVGGGGVLTGVIAYYRPVWMGSHKDAEQG